MDTFGFGIKLIFPMISNILLAVVVNGGLGYIRNHTCVELLKKGE